jgi:hypothetical protein
VSYSPIGLVGDGRKSDVEGISGFCFDRAKSPRGSGMLMVPLLGLLGITSI